MRSRVLYQLRPGQRSLDAVTAPGPAARWHLTGSPRAVMTWAWSGGQPGRHDKPKDIRSRTWLLAGRLELGRRAGPPPRPRTPGHHARTARAGRPRRGPVLDRPRRQ